MPNRVWVLDVPEEDRAELRRQALDPSSKTGIRARIVLLSAAGLPAARIAERLDCSEPTVGLWRRRYATGGLTGLLDAPRRPRRRALDVPGIVASTLTPPPERVGAVHWTSRLLAAELGVSNTTVAKVWRQWGLDPRALGRYAFPTAPALRPGIDDIVGLHLSPSHRAVVVRAGRSWSCPSRSGPALASLERALRAPGYPTVTDLDRFLRLTALATPSAGLAVVYDGPGPPGRRAVHRVCAGVDWLDLVEVFLLLVAPESARTIRELIDARGTPVTWIRPVKSEGIARTPSRFPRKRLVEKI